MDDKNREIDALILHLLNKDTPQEEKKEEPTVSPHEQRIAELEARLAQLEKSPGAIPTGRTDADNVIPNPNPEDVIQRIYEDIERDRAVHKTPMQLTDLKSFIYASKKAGHTNAQILEGIKSFRYD